MPATPFAAYAAVCLLAATEPASAASSDVVVINQPLRTLELVDGLSGRVRLSVRLGVNPHEVEVAPDGRFAVAPIYGDGAVGRPGVDGRQLQVVDLKAGAVRTIDLGEGVRPHDAKFGPDGLLYVTAEVIEAVLIVDLDQGRVIGKIPTGKPQSHALALSPDGRRAYTANVSSGTISVLDLRSRKLQGVVQVAENIQRLSLSPDGRRLYTHDQRSPRVFVVDTEALKVAQVFELPGLTYASASTPDGETLLVAGRPERPGSAPRSPALYLLNLSTGAVETIATVGWPRVIAVEADGAAAWTNLGTGHLLRIDIPSRQVVRTIPLERGLDGMSTRRRR